MIPIVMGYGMPKFAKRSLPGVQRELKRQGYEARLYRWRDIEHVKEDVIEHGQPIKLAIGHSYGVSSLFYAFGDLAEQASCEHCLCLDGVARRYRDRADPQSVTDKLRLTAPNNIQVVDIIWQEEGRFGVLQGHKIDIKPPTVYGEQRLIDATHIQVPNDDCVWQIIDKILMGS